MNIKHNLNPVIINVAIILFIISNNCFFAQQVVDASKYQSVQQALDLNPNTMVFLSPGEYRITKPVRLNTEGSGLYGFGKIIQENPDEHIIIIEKTKNVRIRDIKLTRSKVEFDKRAHAVFINNSNSVTLKDVIIENNRSTIACVYLLKSNYCRVEGCEIINYKTITIDDRMHDDLYGYAFNSMDGHGLMAVECNATQIVRNRIIENELISTKEFMDKYNLGKIVNRREKLGALEKYGIENDFVVIWHQGAGMRITGAGETQFTLIDGNYIENVSQGLDLHTDHVIVTNNHITNAYMGMKAMHGSRGVIISNNVFQRPGKYGIMLRPGSGSYFAQEAEGNNAGRETNVERGVIISNNIISDMGFGIEDWRLINDSTDLSYPVGIKLGYGPLPQNPPLQDVIIEGNIIYDKGLDKVLVNGIPQVVKPRYKYAVWFDNELENKGFHFRGNIFHPGSLGVSNKELIP